MTQALGAYLKELLQRDITVRRLPKSTLVGLPLYLSAAYVPYCLKLFGRELVLVERVGEVGTPSRVAADLERIRAHVGGDVALVLAAMTSGQRSRFIKRGIPFIVPGRQLYLPTFLIDLRENFPRSVGASPRHLSWAAQLTVLRHLLHRDVAERTLGELARLLGYSPMTMTNVARELVAAGLCAVRARGRERRLVFAVDSRDLWDRSRLFLRSPVCRRHLVAGAIAGLSAGICAVAARSGLQPDDKPSVAISVNEYRALADSGAIVESTEEDGVGLSVEEWYYDPRLLSESGTVDPLSLYLSLMDNPDERVGIALDEMLETMAWSQA